MKTIKLDKPFAGLHITAVAADAIALADSRLSNVEFDFNTRRGLLLRSTKSKSGNAPKSGSARLPLCWSRRPVRKMKCGRRKTRGHTRESN